MQKVWRYAMNISKEIIDCLSTKKCDTGSFSGLVEFISCEYGLSMYKDRNATTPHYSDGRRAIIVPYQWLEIWDEDRMLFIHMIAHEIGHSLQFKTGLIDRLGSIISKHNMARLLRVERQAELIAFKICRLSFPVFIWTKKEFNRYSTERSVISTGRYHGFI